MKKSSFLKILVSIIIIISIISLLSGFIVDIQWFKEVGYLGVFFTSLKAKIMIFIPTFIIILSLIYFYIVYLKKNYLKIRGTQYDKNTISHQNKFVAAFSLTISLVVSIIFTSLFWYKILEFKNATAFNIKDPIFNKDAAFYVFKFPLIESVAGILIFIVLILSAVTLLFYAMLKARDGIVSLKGFIDGAESPEARFIARQLAYFSCIFFLLLSGVYYIKVLNLVYSPRGVAFGASYTDVHITLPMFKVISVFCIVASVIIGYSITRKKIKWIIYTAIFMVILIVGQGLVANLVERFIVSPNSMEKEMPYLTYNIKFTRNAYGLENIEERGLSVDNVLSQKDINDNKATVDNIRITEFNQALEVYNQIQAIRSYYRFNGVDIDRYNIGGDIKQVLVAARELDNSNMDQKYQTWQNKHLFYTHGYGAVMSYTNTVNSSGLPVFLMKDIPSNGGPIEIKKPQIYFGEVNNDYIVTGAKSDEIDYPAGNENKKNRYDGPAGIKMSMLNRALFAIDYKSLNFFLSQDISSDSKIIINRNIMDRVQKIAPFINYDNDPYLVASDGGLYWIIDGYTTTDRFPFSEPYKGINYIRNSVKVVVDAYTGKVDFYLYDKKDAIAETIGKIYKGIFKDINQMPQDLRKHIRYSEDVFMLQADVYQKYHMNNPATFYNSDDLWNIAKYRTSDNKDVDVQPVYQIMKLPGDNNEEFVLTIPYTVANKQNMVSLLAVKMNDKSTNMVLTKFPKEKSVYGPQQFDSKINTDTTISGQKTLWGQQGSNVILGEVNIIPIKNSIIYVRPLYLKAQNEKSVPELKKVIVGFGDKVIMEDNIEKAFEKLFNVDVQKPGNAQTSNVVPNDKKVDVKGLVKNAADLFNKAKDAQMKGDWSSYGIYLKDLENTINQLNSKIE